MYITQREAAEILKVSVKVVRRLIKQRVLTMPLDDEAVKALKPRDLIPPTLFRTKTTAIKPLAEALGVTTNYLRRLQRQGDIPDPLSARTASRIKRLGLKTYLIQRRKKTYGGITRFIQEQQRDTKDNLP